MNIYKKVLVAICGIFIISTAYAAEQLSGGQLNVQPEIDKAIVADMNLTSLRFCNDGLNPADLKPKIEISSRPGQLQKICALFFNNLDADMNFYVWFTEATKNKYDERLCDENSSKNSFSKLVREDFAAMKIPVKSHMQSYKNFTLTIPKTRTGDIIGCLTYTIDWSYSKKTWEVFGIVIRKTAPITITVTWSVYNFWRRDDMKEWLTMNRTSILKGLAVILGLWIIITIIQISTKKEKSHKKK